MRRPFLFMLVASCVHVYSMVHPHMQDSSHSHLLTLNDSVKFPLLLLHWSKLLKKNCSLQDFVLPCGCCLNDARQGRPCFPLETVIMTYAIQKGQKHFDTSIWSVKRWKWMFWHCTATAAFLSTNAFMDRFRRMSTILIVNGAIYRKFIVQKSSRGLFDVSLKSFSSPVANYLGKASTSSSPMTNPC